MNNVANNPIHNRGVAAANQTTNSTNANSRSGGRGLCNAVASLCSALHKQITTRSPADARTQNQPVNTTLNDLGSLIVKPFKGIATGFQIVKRDHALRDNASNPIGQTNTARRSPAVAGTQNRPFNATWEGLVGGVEKVDFITPFLVFSLFNN